MERAVCLRYKTFKRSAIRRHTPGLPGEHETPGDWLGAEARFGRLPARVDQGYDWRATTVVNTHRVRIGMRVARHWHIAVERQTLHGRGTGDRDRQVGCGPLPHRGKRLNRCRIGVSAAPAVALAKPYEAV